MSSPQFHLRLAFLVFTFKRMKELGLPTPELLHARGEAQKAFHENRERLKALRLAREATEKVKGT